MVRQLELVLILIVTHQLQASHSFTIFDQIDLLLPIIADGFIAAVAAVVFVAAAVFVAVVFVVVIASATASPSLSLSTRSSVVPSS